MVSPLLFASVPGSGFPLFSLSVHAGDFFCHLPHFVPQTIRGQYLGHVAPLQEPGYHFRKPASFKRYDNRTVGKFLFYFLRRVVEQFSRSRLICRSLTSNLSASSAMVTPPYGVLRLSTSTIMLSLKSLVASLLPLTATANTPGDTVYYRFSSLLHRSAVIFLLRKSFCVDFGKGFSLS